MVELMVLRRPPQDSIVDMSLVRSLIVLSVKQLCSASSEELFEEHIQSATFQLSMHVICISHCAKEPFLVPKFQL